MKTLEDLLHDQIKDVYSGEKQIIDALPEMIEAATDKDLIAALEEHLKQTKTQKKRVEEIAETLGIDPGGEKCKGMEGILKEGSTLVKQDAESDAVRDAAIITACQRVEHYEMAGYGSARTYARTLGNDEVATMLQEILDEEQDADEKLTRIAEGHVNKAAMA